MESKQPSDEQKRKQVRITLSDDISKSEGTSSTDAIDEQIDENLQESMDAETDRGKGGMNRGLGSIGEMQGEDLDDEMEADLDKELHEAAAGEKAEDRGAELYGEKVKDIHP